ncbi:MFS transporter [Paenibacillus segetis]|uniref:Glucitol transport protein GutA n=1 Tax=Paenibacillus segetis TaxID=1325360 RepID=A0ABQ1YQV4_9BACL|nr:glycoside-pentoside-hexuronide (GPH):cation symporter [Paenibacillus segetis]GGH35299.1 putative glucitol transport protein GutA [Paenibacillus segetis]
MGKADKKICREEAGTGNIVGIDKRIPFGEKFSLASLTGVTTFYITMIGTWLLFYYTDIMKINAAYVGGMFVVIRILDAVVTPVFGIYLDRQNTRWGKYKPWVILILMGLAFFGFFTFIPVNFGEVGNIIYVTVTYSIFSLFMSLNQGPGLGLTTATTKVQEDRMNISIWSFAILLIASITVNVGTLPIINALGSGNQAVGFRTFMMIAMIITIIYTLVVMRVSKERFVVTKENTGKMDIKTSLGLFLKNKYAVIAVVYSFTINLSSAIRSGVGIYYYKYYFNDENMMITMGLIQLLPLIIGVALSSIMTKKLGLKKIMLVSVIFSMVTGTLMFFVPPTATGKIMFYILNVIGGTVTGIASPVQGTMTPLAADYGEYKFNMSSGGFIGSLSGFAQTLSTAVAGGFTAITLSAVHYVPNVPQTATALWGIKVLMSIIPAVITLLGLILIKWDMTDDKHKAIINEINQRRSEKSA